MSLSSTVDPSLPYSDILSWTLEALEDFKLEIEIAAAGLAIGVTGLIVKGLNYWYSLCIESKKDGEY